jgi:hypothetical protein
MESAIKQIETFSRAVGQKPFDAYLFRFPITTTKVNVLLKSDQGSLLLSVQQSQLEWLEGGIIITHNLCTI